MPVLSKLKSVSVDVLYSASRTISPNEGVFGGAGAPIALRPIR